MIQSRRSFVTQTSIALASVGHANRVLAKYIETSPSSDVTEHDLRGEFCYETASFPSCHASSLVETNPGRLLITYFGGSDEGNKDVAIWFSQGKVNVDHSVLWTPPTLAHREPGVPCWNPVLFKTADGELLHFFKAGPSPQQWSGFLRRSRDLGKTWGAVELLPSGILGPVRSKPIQLSDGRIVCGSSQESYKAWTCWVETTRDAGRTWTKQGPIVVPGHPHGIIQPSVYALDQKRLRFLCRSRGLGKICYAESNDGGVSWSNARPIDLPNPSAGVDAIALKDGRVALIYNHTPNKRSPLNIAVSEDGGQKFSPALVLEQEPGEYSYPAMIQTADGRIHCSYTWRRQRIKHVSFTL